MTALADALRAAQAQTIAAMQRAFLAGLVNESDLLDVLDNIGCSDKAEQGHLLAALHALSGLGVQGQAQTPASTPQADTEPASKRQMDYAQSLADQQQTTLPGYPLTKAQASKVIEELKAGAYVAESWEVPF